MAAMTAMTACDKKGDPINKAEQSAPAASSAKASGKDNKPDIRSS